MATDDELHDEKLDTADTPDLRSGAGDNSGKFRDSLNATVSYNRARYSDIGPTPIRTFPEYLLRIHTNNWIICLSASHFAIRTIRQVSFHLMEVRIAIRNEGLRPGKSTEVVKLAQQNRSTMAPEEANQLRAIHIRCTSLDWRYEFPTWHNNGWGHVYQEAYAGLTDFKTGVGEIYSGTARNSSPHSIITLLAATSDYPSISWRVTRVPFRTSPVEARKMYKLWIWDFTLKNRS